MVSQRRKRYGSAAEELESLIAKQVAVRQVDVVTKPRKDMLHGPRQTLRPVQRMRKVAGGNSAYQATAFGAWRGFAVHKIASEIQ